MWQPLYSGKYDNIFIKNKFAILNIACKINIKNKFAMVKRDNNYYYILYNYIFIMINIE